MTDNSTATAVLSGQEENVDMSKKQERVFSVAEMSQFIKDTVSIPKDSMIIVKHLFLNRFRVNIFIQVSSEAVVKSYSIVNSMFMIVDQKDGKMVIDDRTIISTETKTAL